MTRRIGCWLVLLPFLLIAGACPPAIAVPLAPALDRDGVRAVLLAAEVARAGPFASSDARPPTWSPIVRQWWAAFSWRGGRRQVLRSADLPPDRWWQA
jgi:hypothetical protein